MPYESKQNSKTKKAYRVLINTGFYAPAFLGGGPIQTLKALIFSAPSDFDPHVVCANHDLGESAPLVDQPNKWLEREETKVRYTEGGLVSLLQAYRSIKEIDLIYLNSFYSPKFSFFPLILWRLGLWRNSTVLLAPRGELHPGALAQKSGKKNLFIRVFRMLRFADLIYWHASTDDEAAQIRSVFGERSRIMIREDETLLPLTAYERPRRAKGPLRLLFVSRLHPQKGLLILLEALQKISEPVQLDIVGSFVDSNYEALCRTAADSLSRHVTVHFHGPMPHEEVLQRMREADFMVLPTAGENFGHVIAEALSSSCPVLCSKNTPWSDVLSSGGGAVVFPNTASTWSGTLADVSEQRPQDWQFAAQEASKSFNKWRNETKGKHIFTQVKEQIETKGSTGLSPTREPL